MQHYISWSGGKDSTASIILAFKHNIKIDGIIFSEVMFDKSQNISGENPLHIKWIYEKAIPRIKELFNYDVTILHADKDFIDCFNHRVTKSKVPERVGKRQGFFIGGMCVGNRDLKMKPIKQYFKNKTDYEDIVGIAIDEPKRLESLMKKTNKRSLLAEDGLTEKDALNLCKEYDLLSPIYNTSSRGGCWFCPNQSFNELLEFKLNNPKLWNKLKELSELPEQASKCFKWGMTFNEVENKLNMMEKKRRF